MENLVQNAASVATTKNLVNYSAMTEIELRERLKEISSFLPQKEKKETAAYLLERRVFSDTVKNDLFGFGKVQRSANVLLKDGGIDAFLKKCSGKQAASFVASRLPLALSSKKVLLKVANGGKDILSCTPNQYLNLVIKFCTLNESTYLKRKAAK